MVPPNPVAAFLYSYSDYIVFGVGLFIAIWAFRKLMISKLERDELEIINDGVESDDNGT